MPIRFGFDSDCVKCAFFWLFDGMYISDIQSNINGRYQYYYIYIVAFDRTHTIDLIFHSRGFYDVPRVLIADATSFKALAAILDYVIQLASMSYWF